MRIAWVFLLFLSSGSVSFGSAPCLPCVGMMVEDGAQAVSAVELLGSLGEDETLFVAWNVPLDGAFDPGLVAQVEAGGATPWLVISFETEWPPADHDDQLAVELEVLADIARDVGPETRFQVEWSGGSGSPDRVEEYAYVLKRASVAIQGANPRARVFMKVAADRPADSRTLVAADIGAYVHGITLEPATEVAPALAFLSEILPGYPVAVNAAAVPSDPSRIAVEAARSAFIGAGTTLFDLRETALGPEQVESLLSVAREFSGDLTPDVTAKEGPDAWAFVRADDLGLRVVVDPGDQATTLVFADKSLADPQVVDIDGSLRFLPWRRTTEGTEIEIPAGGPTVLRIGRLAAIDLGGFADAVDVAGTRRMPVEEILQRLQAFEDGQIRRLRHYEATYTQHLRYRPGGRMEPIEVAFAGPFFFRQGQGFDWVWKDFMIAGVRWKGQIPELPLIQPARAAAMPMEIHLDRQYAYRLRGTAVVQDRDCWVVDFEPVDPEAHAGLWKGTVWVDREVFARVKTRALQLSLEGEVLSNEETAFFEPVDDEGKVIGWTEGGFVLPTRVIGQELQSILNATVQVVKESALTGITINREGVDQRLEVAHAGQSTRGRDTPEGMRYLEREDDGTRTVQEGFDEDRVFGLAGTYYDASFDYPLPLIGVDYFSNDVAGTGAQTNIFFAGVLVNANIADPSFLGSRWDIGARLGGVAIAGEQDLYRNGVEVEGETIESRGGGLDFFLGHPLGSFAKVDFTYGIDYDSFGRADGTAADFVVPESTFTQSLGIELTYSRGGYRISAEGFAFERSDWGPWGLPGSGDYDPAHKDYKRWRVGLAKSWWVSGYTKLGLRMEHLDGQDLDRFSKFGFHTFGDSRVAGYQRGLVTAESADVIHLSYGFNLADLLRLELRGDVAWATDEATGLDNELLAGLSLNGTLIGPWQTIVNFDIGIPIEGPAEDFTLSVVFLKLF